MGRPRERRPLFGGVYVLVPIWLGAPRPAWQPDPLIERGPAGFLGRYLVTVIPIHTHTYPVKTVRVGRSSVVWLCGLDGWSPVRA